MNASEAKTVHNYHYLLLFIIMTDFDSIFIY